MAITLCHHNDIEDPGSKGFQIQSGEDTLEIFVVCKDGQFYGYLNSCPHTGASLNWQQDQFLDMDKALIQCSTHDALFEMETGQCIAGPCFGDQLKSIAISIVVSDSSAENGFIVAEP